MNATHWIARMQLLGARAESAAKASAMSRPTGYGLPAAALVAGCAGAEVSDRHRSGGDVAAAVG